MRAALQRLVRRAVLIAGGLDAAMLYPRYRNDLELWNATLLARGFEQGNIESCFGPGGASIGGVPASAGTKDGIITALARCSSLRSDDLLIVVVSNHGTPEGIVCWKESNARPIITPAELTTSLATCPATKLLVLGQCHAGVFAASTPNAVIAMACSATEPSYAALPPPGAAYDEFLFWFADALRTSPGPIRVSAVFEHAKERDRARESPFLIDPANLAATILL